MWTKPYCSITHRVINRRQGTVIDYGTFATAIVFPVPGSTDGFLRDSVEREFKTVAEAKAWVETIF